MAGKKLIEKLAMLTGLPTEGVSKELLQLIEKQGFDYETLELADIRSILADYLQDVLLEAKQEYTDNFTESVSPLKQ